MNNEDEKDTQNTTGIENTPSPTDETGIENTPSPTESTEEPKPKAKKHKRGTVESEISKRKKANLEEEKKHRFDFIKKPVVWIPVVLVLVVVVMLLAKNMGKSSKTSSDYLSVMNTIVNNELGSWSYTVTATDSERDDSDLTFYLTGCTANSSDDALNAWFSLAVNDKDNVLVSGIIEGDGIWKFDVSTYEASVKSLGVSWLTTYYGSYSNADTFEAKESDLHLHDMYRRWMVVYAILTSDINSNSTSYSADDAVILTDFMTRISKYYDVIEANVETKASTSKASYNDSFSEFQRYVASGEAEVQKTEGTSLTSIDTVDGYSDASATLTFTYGRYALGISCNRTDRVKDYPGNTSDKTTELTADTYAYYISGIKSIINAKMPLGIYLYDTDYTLSDKLAQELAYSYGLNLNELAEMKSRGEEINLPDILSAYDESVVTADSVVFSQVDCTVNKIDFVGSIDYADGYQNIICVTLGVTNNTGRDITLYASDFKICSDNSEIIANSNIKLGEADKNFNKPYETEWCIADDEEATIVLYFPCSATDLNNTELSILSKLTGVTA